MCLLPTIFAMWRRHPGKNAIGAHQQFAAVVRGKVHGPLGQNLIQATFNLIATRYRLEANRHSGLEAPSQAPNYGPDDEERKKLRTWYLGFLQTEFGKSGNTLEFNQLLEDDTLSAAFLDAAARGQDPASLLPMVLTAEGDPKLGDSHVVEFGPRGVQFLVDALGLDIGVTTVEALLDNKALPRPLASVQPEASGESEPQSLELEDAEEESGGMELRAFRAIPKRWSNQLKRRECLQGFRGSLSRWFQGYNPLVVEVCRRENSCMAAVCEKMHIPHIGIPEGIDIKNPNAALFLRQLLDHRGDIMFWIASPCTAGCRLRHIPRRHTTATWPAVHTELKRLTLRSMPFAWEASPAMVSALGFKHFDDAATSHKLRPL